MILSIISALLNISLVFVLLVMCRKKQTRKERISEDSEISERSIQISKRKEEDEYIEDNVVDKVDEKVESKPKEEGGSGQNFHENVVEDQGEKLENDEAIKNENKYIRTSREPSIKKQNELIDEKVEEKRDEPEVPQPQGLIVEPLQLQFNKDGGKKTLSIKNQFNQRIAFKIKCSDNTLFRVNPVFNFINKGEAFNVEIYRFAGKAKSDKLDIVTIEVPNDAENARTLFAEAPPEKITVTHINIVVDEVINE